MVWGMGLLAAGSVVLGVAPQLAVNYFLNPILAALGLGAGVHVTWLGLSADAGSFSRPAAWCWRWFRWCSAAQSISSPTQPARRRLHAGAAMAGAGGGVFTGGEPLSDQGRLTAGDFSEIFQEHWRSFFRWSNVDRVYLGLWVGLASRLARARRSVVAWMERDATFSSSYLSPPVFVLVRWIVPGVKGRRAANRAPIALGTDSAAAHAQPSQSPRSPSCSLRSSERPQAGRSCP